MPSPQNRWHPRSCDTTTPRTPGLLTNRKQFGLTGRAYLTRLTTVSWALHITLLILLLDCTQVTAQGHQSKRRTDIDVIARFHLEKYRQSISVKYADKQAYLKKEARISKAARRLRLWQLLPPQASGNDSAFSLLVSVAPDDPARPYYLLSVHDSKKRMQLGVKVFPGHVLISYKKHHRKVEFPKTLATPGGQTNFALVFKDGSVGVSSNCGQSIQERPLVGIKVRDVLSTGVNNKCKVVLGRHRAKTTAFEGTICQLTMHRGEYAARNYCKFVRRRCREERSLRGQTVQEDENEDLPTSKPTYDGTSMHGASLNTTSSTNATTPIANSLEEVVTKPENTDSVANNSSTNRPFFEASWRVKGSAGSDNTFTDNNIILSASRHSNSPEAHGYKLVSRDINEDVRWPSKLRSDDERTRLTDSGASKPMTNIKGDAGPREINPDTVTVQDNPKRVIHLEGKPDAETFKGYDSSSAFQHAVGRYQSAKSQRPGIISASSGFVQEKTNPAMPAMRDPRLKHSATSVSSEAREDTHFYSDPTASQNDTQYPRGTTASAAYGNVGYGLVRTTSNEAPTSISSATVSKRNSTKAEPMKDRNPTTAIPELRVIGTSQRQAYATGKVETKTYETLSSPILPKDESPFSQDVTTAFVTPTPPTHDDSLYYDYVTPDPKDGIVLVPVEDENDESGSRTQGEEPTMKITIGQISYKLPVSALASLLCNNDHSGNEEMNEAARVFCARKGPKGEPGLRGPTGPPGKPGRRGRDGIPGPYGPYGMPGLPGDPGPKGQRGDPALFGRPGFKGIKGDKGDTGPIGIPGMVGSPGEDGTHGPAGAPGYSGAPGRNGRHGPSGFPGRVRMVLLADLGSPGPTEKLVSQACLAFPAYQG